MRRLLILFCFLVLLCFNSCSTKAYIGSYSQKLGTTNYYETLQLNPDSTFIYQDGVYVNSSKGPYMPVMYQPPRYIGKGKYEFKGRKLILYYDGVANDRVVVSESKNETGIQIRIFEGQDDTLGLIGAIVQVKNHKDDSFIAGEMTDIDGKTNLEIDPDQYPLLLEFSFIGFQKDTINLEKYGNYHIELRMQYDPIELMGTKEYKIKKQKGKYWVDRMWKF